jgi:hypothetical protein
VGEQDNLNPNPSLFDIANYIQGVIDNFDGLCFQRYCKRKVKGVFCICKIQKADA